MTETLTGIDRGSLPPEELLRTVFSSIVAVAELRHDDKDSPGYLPDIEAIVEQIMIRSNADVTLQQFELIRDVLYAIQELILNTMSLTLLTGKHSPENQDDFATDLDSRFKAIHGTDNSNFPTPTFVSDKYPEDLVERLLAVLSGEYY